MSRALLLAAWLLAVAVPLHAQTDTTPQGPSGVAVVFDGDTLFTITARLGPFSPDDRAAAILQRLTRVAEDPDLSPAAIAVAEGESTTDIVVGDVVIHSVTDADAAAAGVERAVLARQRADRVAQALERESLWTVIRTMLVGLAFTLLATAVLVALWRLLNWVFPKVTAQLEEWRGTRIPAIRIQRLEFVSADRLTDLLIAAARIVRIAIIVILLFYFVPLVFSFFPWTENVADRIFDYIVAPLKQVGNAFVAYIPNLFFIAIIVLVTRYLLRFIRFFFDGIERGTLQFRNFYPEWAQPTYKIVRFMVLAFALVVIFPYLPGSGTDAFKGVSVFIGVLVSFGSASAIANVVAGAVITYMRPFKLGDRVKIAETVGDVVDRNLLVTRVRTIKNVDISIPNALVLANHIVNYSAVAEEHGVILHTAVTIGYDAPWRTVHGLLIAAAKATEGILAEPSPFVRQTALNDFYVTYEINGYTDRPNEMNRIYSDLHQNIQDQFNEAGVEIMSPHYGALRDGNQITIPDEHLPKNYRTPGFRVFPFTQGGGPGGAPGEQERHSGGP